MKRIDTSRAANTFQGAAGGSGHFQDTDPAGGTQLDAMWFEGLQEDIVGVVVGLGGVLTGDQTEDLWPNLQPRVDGIFADATDTGSVANAYTRVVIASTSGRATGADSAVIASSSSTANAARAAVVGSYGSTVNTVGSTAMASSGVIVSGGGSIGTGENMEIADDDTVAGGYSGTTITASGVNQNVKWALRSADGMINQSMGTGTTSSGAVTIDTPVGIITHDLAGLAGGDHVDITLNNSLITGSSMLQFTFAYPGSANTYFNLMIIAQSAGSATIRITNETTTAANASPDNCYIHFRVVNPT